MTNIKLIILAMLTGNILLLGLEASKPPAIKAEAKDMQGSTATELPTLRLLSEMSEAEPGSLRRQCFTVGPFESIATVEAIVELLDEYTSSISPRETEAFVDRGYWVYLPPFSDEPAARQAVNTLYNAGLEDVSYVNEGEWNNSVSLGYFINQSNAAQHRNRVRELGFDAEFRIQRDDESRYWVDYEQQAGIEYASRMLVGLVPAQLHRSTTCAKRQDSNDVEPAPS